MELANAPSQLVEAWAAGDSSKTNPIPVPSQQGVTPGAASWTDGFPPLCAEPIASGGIPPSKADMNGGLYQMSAVDVWMCAGGGFPYNSAFSASIGGYPKGARVLMASGNGYWVSTADNNVTDPDTGGAGWASADENAITALTGDVTAAGPGSAAATLATVNSAPGSYVDASITVDAKGRVTAAASGPAKFNIVAMWNGASGTLVDDGEGGSGYQSGAINWGVTITGPYRILAATGGWPGGGSLGQRIVCTVVATPIDGETFSYGVDIPTISAGRGYTIPSITCIAVQ
jgi:hypothetical protein